MLFVSSMAPHGTFEVDSGTGGAKRMTRKSPVECGVWSGRWDRTKKDEEWGLCVA